ncbi:hypothetical protein [Limnohabitans sp. T6-5]|uniref:hypothetical protein n=1 Tax=Limnohabitans sp. T6-5 TaxID=1100724 RepID=UPI0011B1EC5B|nr:hypothetical protein [Limnohabitans sp. T6-5]
MPNTNAAIYDDIVRELAPTVNEPDEATITIVCKLLNRLDGSAARGSISMSPLASTPPEEARAIASTGQARDKRLSHLQTWGDEAA